MAPWGWAVLWLDRRRPACEDRPTCPAAHQGSSPCCLWGQAGRLWGPQDSGHHLAGWMRTCLSSRRRPLSRPAEPAGRGESLGSPMGLGWGRPSPPETHRAAVREAQRSAEREWCAHSEQGGLPDGGERSAECQAWAGPRAGELLRAMNPKAGPLAPTPRPLEAGQRRPSWQDRSLPGAGCSLRPAHLEVPALPLACHGDTFRSRPARSSGGRWNRTGCR